MLLFCSKLQAPWGSIPSKTTSLAPVLINDMHMRAQSLHAIHTFYILASQAWLFQIAFQYLSHLYHDTLILFMFIQR